MNLRKFYSLQELNMDEDQFEDSLVLEMLAEHDLLDEFFEAIDNDNLPKAIALMRRAQMDEETIQMTIKKIRESNGEE